MDRCPHIGEKEDCNMKTTFIILLGLAAFGLHAQTADENITLVSEGKALYSVSARPLASRKAVSLLNDYVGRISGAILPERKSKAMIVFTDEAGKVGKQACDSMRAEGFIIRTTFPHMYIWAADSTGYCNAVYYLLEHAMHCRFYAPGALVIPKRKTLTFAPVSTIQNPVFHFRINYNGGAFDAAYAAWHGLHNMEQKPDAAHFDISDNWGMWVHTMHRLVSPERYFKTHPEYYALRNGVRVSDQLCLSHPEVAAITIASLREEMKKNPDALYWSVSQMDNFSYCECDRCKAIDSANGSPSGSVIAFANMIAEAFPDKIISTLAYQYSRKAPTQIKPRPNVNIMLCTIECNRHEPIAHDRSEGGFAYDLQQWGALTRNILVWDYVINFSNILGPFPNLHVLKPNLQLFRDNHVSMLFEQGWPRPSGEMTELRCYLLSKLMWNPELNTDSLITDFCMGYYGPSGQGVIDYVMASRSHLLQSERALTLYEPMSAHADGFLSPQNISTYYAMIDGAWRSNNGLEPYHTRLQLAMQPLRYAWLEVAKSKPFTASWIFKADGKGGYAVCDTATFFLDELCSMAMEHGPGLFHETGIPPQQYREIMEDYFVSGYTKHLACGRKVKYKNPCSAKYNGGGATALTDGVSGTSNYFVLWQGWDGEDADLVIDMDSLVEVRSVEIHTLSNSLSWIFPADTLKVWYSEDGTQFTEAGFAVNYTARDQGSNEIIPMQVRFNEAVEARYIRVHISCIGRLPAWRGIDGNAWLFVDEIIVQ